MSTSEMDPKIFTSALSARELESAKNTKELLDEHVARTGGKARLEGG